jgi:hypothetical protein
MRVRHKSTVVVGQIAKSNYTKVRNGYNNLYTLGGLYLRTLPKLLETLKLK